MSDTRIPEAVWRKKVNFREAIYIWEVLRGLGITIRYLIRNIFRMSEMPTMQYPEEKRVYSSRYRGRHRLMHREDGSPRCVACMMCSTVCPADCIMIEAGEHSDPRIEKFPESFEIDLSRCMFCGLCEEACPEEAIVMSPDVEIACESRGGLVWNKEQLLKPARHLKPRLDYIREEYNRYESAEGAPGDVIGATNARLGGPRPPERPSAPDH